MKQTFARGMDVKAAADYSGLSVRTLRTLIATGELKVARVGRKIIVLRDQLDELLDRATRERVATA